MRHPTDRSLRNATFTPVTAPPDRERSGAEAGADLTQPHAHGAPKLTDANPCFPRGRFSHHARGGLCGGTNSLPTPWRSLGGRVDRGFSGGGELNGDGDGDGLDLVVSRYFDGWIQTVRGTHTPPSSSSSGPARPSSCWAAMQEQGVGKTSTAAAWNKL